MKASNAEWMVGCRYAYFRNEPQSLKDFFTVRYSEIEDELKEHNIVLRQVVKNDTQIKIFNDSTLEENITFFYGTNITTVCANSYTHTIWSHGVSIGRYCSIGGSCRIFAGRHHPHWISTSPKFYRTDIYSSYEKELTFLERSRQKINIGNDVWIGSHAAFAQDITIGDGAIIASGAVVTHDVPPFAVVGGVPAKLIRYRFDDETIARILNVKWWNYEFDDIVGLRCDNPCIFLDNIEERIASGRIKFYDPSIIHLNKWRSYQS